MTSTGNGSGKRVAIVGAGYIADYHAGALKRLDSTTTVAVCDLNRARASVVAQKHDIPAVYTSLDDMLASEQIDVVHLLVPPELHFGVAVQLLEAGIDLFLEKPMCATAAECRQLEEEAAQRGRRLGVNHNFLYFPLYKRLASDLADKTIGKLDQVDVVWNKELGQIQGGPHNLWMFDTPTNILFEVGPHSFAHVLDIVGEVDDLKVQARDRVDLPNGKGFYRRWEISGWHGTTSVRMRFSFVDGYPDHYVRVRGSNAVATVDFERNTYCVQRHTGQQFDLDRYSAVASTARETLTQARSTLRRIVLSKMGSGTAGGPFAESFVESIGRFYDQFDGELDAGLSARFATRSIELATRIAASAEFVPALTETKTHTTTNGASRWASQPIVARERKSRVLVLGGTGFIGRALVRRLHELGHAVTVLARNPNKAPPEWKTAGIETARGDFADVGAIESVMEGVDHVYHLARGHGSTWDEYQRYDVEPTRHLAELCVKHGVRRLHYASSIAIYYAGRNAKTITEETQPHPALLRCNLYAAAKVECEKLLLEMAASTPLEVVIFRPGIVVGPGGSPYHWGVGMWPYKSVCRLWGDGDSPLPFVLVDDVADGMARAADVDGISGHSYNLVGSPGVTANDYIDEFERHAGVRIHRVPTSAWRYYGEDVAKWLIKTVGRDPGRRRPSLADYDGRTCVARFVADKAKTELGWAPNDDRSRFVREGIAAPVAEFVR